MCTCARVFTCVCVRACVCSQVIKCVLEQRLEPAIVFAFSRKECEALALQLSRSGKFQMTTEEEQVAIKEVYDQVGLINHITSKSQ